MKKNNKLKSAIAFIGIMLSASIIAQTTNYVPKWSGSAYVNTTTPIFEDATNSRIGIGTTTPGYKLDVNGDINAGGSSTSTTNGFYLGTSKILWHRGVTTCIFAGVGSGGSTTGSNNSFFGYNTGNANTTGAQNTAIGANALKLNTTGYQNVAIGFESMPANTTGLFNTAVGVGTLWSATSALENTALGYLSLHYNTTGGGNLATGTYALYNNIDGNSNVAVGAYALYNNTDGEENLAVGNRALNDNSSGNNNTAFGHYSLKSNTTDYNSAFGDRALYSNTTGTPNSAFGHVALYTNSTGYLNDAFGDSTLYANTTGIGNTSFGTQSMRKTTTGNNNVAVGAKTLYSNTTGGALTGLGFAVLNRNTTASYSTGVGYEALLSSTGANNTAIGALAGFTNTTGQSNSYFGYGADGSANNLNNSTAIGNTAVVNATNKVRIGNGGVTVIEGQVAYTTSDRRFKNNIKEDVKGLEFIQKLRPVIYNFDGKKLDEFLMKNMPDSLKKMRIEGIDYTASQKIVHAGFIAQEVEQAAKECNFITDIVHSPGDENDNYSIAYQVIVVPLVKAVQEQQVMIDNLKQENTKQNDINNALQNQINEINIKLAEQQTTEIKVELSDKNAIVLNDAVPNPFAEQTMIGYTIAENAVFAQIIFYNNLGQLIKAVDIKSKGRGQLSVFANDLSNGIYSYSLIVDGKVIDTKKLVKTE